MVWYKTVTYGFKPSSRYGVTMNRYGDDIYVIGGCSAINKNTNEVNCFNDIYILNVNTLYWRYKIESRHDQWIGKEGHTSVFYNPYIIVTGGSSSK
jgi:N-acetylneuraminic acid mutarotase